MINDDLQARVNGYYERYDEENRLVKDYSHQVEFLTTTDAMSKFIPEQSRILDVAAGTGAYAFYLSRREHAVWTQDLSKRYVEIMLERQREEEHTLESIRQSNILAGLEHEDSFFDVVLCMGPIYHLETEGERNRCLSECKRVLRPKGKIFISYLLTPKEDVSESDSVRRFYDRHEFFYVDDSKELEQYIESFDIEILDHFCSDGISLKIARYINQVDDKVFAEWIKFHRKICRTELIFKFGIHGVIVGELS